MTPVNVDNLKYLLEVTGYNAEKTQFLVDGFTNRFSLEYTGCEEVKITAPNLKLRVGDEIDLWNKVMKEVEMKRFAGPFVEPPFEHFIQSSIGLVPKDNGKDVRLIFHLSYPKNGTTSVNANTDPEKCSVKYPDLTDAIVRCLEEGCSCFSAKSDMRSAFRQLGVLKRHWKLLLMKCKDPESGQIFWFVDKAVPFGHGISCSLFQSFSDAVSHIVEYFTKKVNINYLDDFFFVALLKAICDEQVATFLETCKFINFPVSMEKTIWGQTCLTFLGFLIDTVNQIIAVPMEKISRAINMITYVLNKPKKSITLLQLQKIGGFLNFLGKAIIPGRAFTRRLYSHVNSKLLPHHHLRITKDMRLDLTMWLHFLQTPQAFYRPFMDLTKNWYADELDFYSDATTNPILGMGAKCQKSWMFTQWDPVFITDEKPSIMYLELYAVTAAVLAWIHRFENRRIILFCDNIAVCYMINKTTSSCMKCMILIRIIVFQSLIHNVRIFAKYVPTWANSEADDLSRRKLEKFAAIAAAKNYDREPTSMPSQIWPMQKVWYL